MSQDEGGLAAEVATKVTMACVFPPLRSPTLPYGKALSVSMVVDHLFANPVLDIRDDLAKAYVECFPVV